MSTIILPFHRRTVGALVLCVGGYYLYELIITKSFAAPVASIPGNLLQIGFSFAVYTVIGTVLDKMKIKSRLGL